MLLLDAVLESLRRDWSHLIDQPEDHRLQILLTPLRLAEDWIEHPETENFRADAEYFYPASTVKLLAAIAAARWVNLVGHKGPHAGLTLDSPLIFQPDDSPALATDDTNPQPGHPITLRHCIRRALVVSENESHNRIHDFLGHALLNMQLESIDCEQTVINHRLDDTRPPAQHRIKPRVTAATADGRTIEMPRREDDPVDCRFMANLRGTKVGAAHMRGGTLINEPMDFAAPSAEKNRVRLVDLHRIIRHFVPAAPSLAWMSPVELGLDPADWAFLRDCLSMLPRDCPAPRYDPDKYPDEYAKPLLPGVRSAAVSLGTAAPTITNKLGWAYGFVTDTAVIHDERDAVAVTYTAWSCPDGVMNADRYGYKEIERFVARFGEVLWGMVKRGP